MLKKFFLLALKYLPSIGLLAAAVYLFNIDFVFQFGEIGISNFILSFIFIVCFFFIRAVVWYLLLKRYDIGVSLKISIYSQFKTIFTKYIPGKIWVILSSASIISKEGYSLKKVSGLSLLHLIIQTIAGLTVGILGLLIFDVHFLNPLIAIILLVAIISLVLLITLYKELPGIRFFKKVPGLESFSNIEIKPAIDLIIISSVQWVVLGIAYYFLLASLNINIGFEPILLQPLANNIGIIVPIAPGGIGIREYAMIGYLSTLMELKEAGNFAILSRIWFFIAEFIIFSITMIKHLFINQSE